MVMKSKLQFKMILLGILLSFFTVGVIEAVGENITCSSFSDHDYKTGTKEDRVRWYCRYDSYTHRLVSETQYVNGLKQGKSIGFYKNGNAHTIYNYWNNRRVGVQVTILENGRKRCLDLDREGNVIHHQNSAISGHYDCQ
jgi:hypothetical protein